MKVECKDECGGVLWSFDHVNQENITSLTYLRDGTQQEIITALELMLVS
jgi:hypothetical protein